MKETEIKKREFTWVIVTAILAIALMFSQFIMFSGAGQAFNVAKVMTSSSCSETDGGNIEGVYGLTTMNVKGKLEKNSDSCVSGVQLKEYYCQNNQVVTQYYDCGCVDGLCDPNILIEKREDSFVILNTKTTVINSQTGVYVASNENDIVGLAPCTDSDKGKTYGEVGTTSDFEGSTSKADVCQSDGRLVEYYCDSNEDVRSETVSCSSGKICSGGACLVVRENCIDSESSLDLYTTGTVSGQYFTNGVRGSWTDDCSLDGKVMEYYCTESGSVYYNAQTCPLGYACNGGKCVDTCYDTDVSGSNGGINYDVKGITSGYWRTTGTQGSWMDYCTSYGELIEYFCSEEYVYSSRSILCSSLGKTCTNGACV